MEVARQYMFVSHEPGGSHERGGGGGIDAPQPLGGLVVLLEQRSPNLLRLLDAQLLAHEPPHVPPLHDTKRPRSTRQETNAGARRAGNPNTAVEPPTGGRAIGVNIRAGK